ncbi:hypothetical protein LCGC14_0364830 [marine sediment metagenome]|uniref:Uncharacterized protein n=1 Tax=marine sediment metagenome TaxID=412755 RepID=A0A0F9VU52_9ZZZZ
MRYNEAYNFVENKVKKHNINVGERLLNTFFDNTVKDLGLRLVRKEDFEEFAVSGNSYVFTKENFNGQIFRVQRGTDDPLPPVEKSLLKIEAYSRGYYLDRNFTTGLITAGTSADPIKLTSVGHGLTTSYHVMLSEIIGLLNATGELSALNDLKHTITVVDDDNFSVAIDGSGYAVAWSSGGKWECVNYVLQLGATPDTGTLKVDYVAKPELRTSLASRIDLPDSLLLPCIHTVIADLYDLEGDIPVPVGDKFITLKPGDKHRTLAVRGENQYLQQKYRREITPYVLSSAMQELI